MSHAFYFAFPHAIGSFSSRIISSSLSNPIKEWLGVALFSYSDH